MRRAPTINRRAGHSSGDEPIAALQVKLAHVEAVEYVDRNKRIEARIDRIGRDARRVYRSGMAMMRYPRANRLERDCIIALREFRVAAAAAARVCCAPTF